MIFKLYEHPFQAAAQPDDEPEMAGDGGDSWRWFLGMKRGERLFRRNRAMFPDWFVEALKAG